MTTPPTSTRTSLCLSLCLRQSVVAVLLFVLAAIQSANAMRLVIQRVKAASVTVSGEKVSSIGPGLVALVGLHEHDSNEDLQYCCRKLLAAKLWPNDNGGQWRHGVKQRNLDLLCVSQFTLYGKLSKKNQPDYKYAMKNEPARKAYHHFLQLLRESYDESKIHDGAFGEMMDVDLTNDGPVTIVIESDPKPPEEEPEESAKSSTD
mmetsp:Transcript_5415/g.9206  ORF Transcript_5415/g.9206 Transcript_5415/m.9206 type:complete len:205 (-) Transcript_5415:474-1088(-)